MDVMPEKSVNKELLLYAREFHTILKFLKHNKESEETPVLIQERILNQMNKKENEKLKSLVKVRFTLKKFLKKMETYKLIKSEKCTKEDDDKNKKLKKRDPTKYRKLAVDNKTRKHEKWSITDYGESKLKLYEEILE